MTNKANGTARTATYLRNSDLSTLVKLAALTTDRSPAEQAALTRVAGWLDAQAGLTVHTEAVGG